MRLSKLKISGFKTFVDPTMVQTPGVLVGVVGPNGCGKSNIIDAVRWVLGETRASALRGESMQDVIFNGSTTRKPVSRASVELIFDNAQGRAAGQWSQYAEIAVKRVLDRSGESSYYINAVHVRRRDVIDLFLGTGLGPRAYAIIEQGMISRIIEARPEDVRGFLEEAAGVTKYRERRKETEGRLTDAADNLSRLDDIRNELADRIGHLEGQALVAERYRRLSDSHAERQNLLWLLKRNEARAVQECSAQALAGATRRIETDNARLQELEQAVEDARGAHYAASEAVHGAQSDLYAATAEVSRLEAEVRHRGESRQRISSRLDALEREDVEWSARRDQLQQDGERWQGLDDNAALRVEQAEARHEEASARLPEAEQGFRDAEATANAARRELSQAEQQMRVEETRRGAAERALAALVQRRERLEQESAQIQGPDELALAQREARLELMREELAGGEESLAREQARLPLLQQSLREAVETERQAQRKLTELRARLEALRQLQHKVHAQGQVGDWLRRAGLLELPPLWRDLQVETGWESALEAALRERLGALCGAGREALELALSDPPPGNFALLLDGPATPATALPDGLRPLRACVTGGSDVVGHALDAWLAGYAVVEDFAPWLKGIAELPPALSLVNRRGQLLGAHGLSQYAPDARTQGVVERQREIDLLEAGEAEAEASHHDSREAVLDAEAAASEQQARLGEARQRNQALQQQIHTEQVEVLKLTQARTRAEERRSQIARDLADLAHSEDTEREQLQRAQLELARGEALAEMQRARLDDAQEVQRERELALRDARTLEQASARDKQEAAFSARECRAKLEELARNHRLAEEQLLRIAAERERNEAELAACDDGASRAALEEALQLRDSREAALVARRDALAEASAKLRECEEQRLRTEQAAAPLRDQVAELRLQVQAAELAQAQAQERLVEAGADEAALAPLLTPDIKETSLQREVARLSREIAELGAVNLAAVDELQAASTRKGYLDAQNEDLSRAIETLEEAIRRIDRETREQLQETYDTVNRQFGLLFPQLFGGGEARLVLTGEEILDAGIQIVAQPPGKKNSSIHLLSGGEKALTAIALVFSLFQLNPAPFCMLDEVDAPLDDSNTERFCNMVKRMSSQTQFLFISHSKITMEIAQQLVGVTMQEQGVSRVVEVDIEEALRLAEAAAV